MPDDFGLWSEDIGRVITRLEIRLEQYRIHADELQREARDREGVDALVKRLEERLAGLRAYKAERRSSRYSVRAS
jgi:hypothetical protein